MSETFDFATTNPGSGGTNLAGDSFTQLLVDKFLPAGYLVFGPQDGPYTRVDSGAGLPVEIQNTDLPVSQSGSWQVAATQSGPWVVGASQLGTWDIGTLSTITNVVHVDDNGASLTVDGDWLTNTQLRASPVPVSAAQSGTWTVQPGNTANTTAWLVTGTGGTFPITGTVTISGAVDTELTTADLDTGAGTDTRAVVGMVLAESGGGQLVGSAHPMPVSGTVAATQSGTWNIGTLTTITNVVHVDDNGASLTVDGDWLTNTQLRASPVPVSGTVSISGSVDTELTTADLDTGAGTDTRAVVGLVLAESGGGLLVGSAHPMPVSGTVAATQSGTWTVQPGNTANTTAWKVDGSAVTQPVSLAAQPGAPNLANNQVSVDTTSGGVTIVSTRATRRAVTIVNHGTTAVYVGTGTVSTSNGLFLVGIAGASVTIWTTAAVKGIVASGSQTVSYMEEYD